MPRPMPGPIAPILIASAFARGERSIVSLFLSFPKLMMTCDVEKADKAEREHRKHKRLNEAHKQLKQYERDGDDAAHQAIHCHLSAGDDDKYADHGCKQHFAGEDVAKQPEAVGENLAQLR